MFIVVSTGNTAPFHITQPAVDHYVQIVPPTAKVANLTCSLNITIPSSVLISWVRNNVNLPYHSGTKTGKITTLTIRNLSSNADVYQCWFNDAFGSGWTLHRNIKLIITSMLKLINNVL